jgi:hypothetical protein
MSVEEPELEPAGVEVGPFVGACRGDDGPFASALWLTELSLEAVRLNTLDDLWTSYVGGEAASDADALRASLPELQVVVGEMGRLLGSISVKAPKLASLAQSTPDLDGQLKTLLDWLAKAGWEIDDIALPSPLSGEVVAACDLIVERAPYELADLAEKLQKIADGAPAGADLHFPVKKAVFVVLIGAGVMATGGALLLPAVPAAVFTVLSLASQVGMGVFALDEMNKAERLPKKGPKQFDI